MSHCIPSPDIHPQILVEGGHDSSEYMWRRVSAMRIVWKSIQYYFPLSIGTVCQALLSCDYEVSPSSINYDLLTNTSHFVQLTLGQSKDCTRAFGIFLYGNNQIKSQLNTTTPCLVLGIQSNIGWRHDMEYCPQYWSPMKGIHRCDRSIPSQAPTS